MKVRLTMSEANLFLRRPLLRHRRRAESREEH